MYAHASFVVCSDEKDVKGFTAFYKNVEAKQLYVTLICVDKQLQGQGLGSKMLETLESLKSEGFEAVALEVLKTNQTAYHFYKKHGFIEQEDRGEKFLMRKTLQYFSCFVFNKKVWSKKIILSNLSVATLS